MKFFQSACSSATARWWPTTKRAKRSSSIPATRSNAYREILARHDLKVRYIIATHAHIDHVGGLKKLHEATGAPVMMHQADLPLYQNLAAQAAWLGVETPGMVEVDQFLKEGDRLRWGALSR